MLVGIEAQADRDAIEDQRRFAVDAGEHDGAAAQAELPVGNAAVGRLEMGEQRDPVRAGNDLERRDQHAPSGIPFDVHFGRIDRHRIIGRIAVDDVAGAGGELAAEIGRQAVAAQFALQFAGQRQVGAVGEVLQPQRQQDVRGRHLVGADIDRSHAVGGGPTTTRSDHGTRALFADAERHAAAARPAKAEADILEVPFVAALLIVDDQVAVLQTDLVEVLAVEPGQAQAVEPVEPGEQSVLRRVGRRRAGGARADGAPAQRPRECRRACPASLLRGDAGGERLGGVAGGDGDVAIRRDPHREFGIDQIEAFGAQPPHQQRGAGQFHLGFRRARDDGMVAIPDDDVADAHGDADPAGALDLRAADLDGVAVADIFLDRSRKPRRRHVEIDRTGAEPPPQRRRNSRRRSQPRRAITTARRLTQRSPASQRLQRRELVAEPVKAGIRPRQQPARAMARRLVMVLIPVGIIPLRDLGVGTRIRP